MTRSELILDALDDALAKWTRAFKSQDCIEDEWDDLERDLILREKTSPVWAWPTCDGCVDNSFGAFLNLEHDNAKVVTKLLDDFGLVFLERVGGFSEEKDTSDDIFRSWAISLPVHLSSPSSKTPSPKTSPTLTTSLISEANHDTFSSTPAQAIISPDRPLPTRPSNGRFKALISTYHLEVHTFLLRPLIA